MFSNDTTRNAGPFSGFGSSGEMKLPTTSIPSPFTSGGFHSALGGSYGSSGQMPNFSGGSRPTNWMDAAREPVGLVSDQQFARPAAASAVAPGNQMPLPPQAAPAQDPMHALPQQMPLPMPSRFMSQLPPEAQNLFGPLTTALQSHPIMRLLSMLLRRPGGGTGGLRDLFNK